MRAEALRLFAVSMIFGLGRIITGAVLHPEVCAAVVSQEPAEFVSCVWLGNCASYTKVKGRSRG